MTMFPSACVWNFPPPVAEVLKQVKLTAFHYIDVEPATLDTAGDLQAQKELGLKVSCVALDHGLPGRGGLDGLRKAVPHLKQALQKAADLQAACAYLSSCQDSRQLAEFGGVLRELADHASRHQIKLCLEHAPGRALASASEALRFVRQLDHPNLYLLLDIGHALLSREDPSRVIREAGPRIGYVQVNDNDGKKDRHWALLDGRLTRETLAGALEALKEVHYQGTLGLEVSGDFASVIGVFSRNRNLLLRLQLEQEAKSLKEPETRRKA
jgi:sugar phosphate isomerase/epimerase